MSLQLCVLVPLHSVKWNYWKPLFSLNRQTKPKQLFMLMLLNQTNVNEDERFISLDVGDPSLSELV